MPTVITRTVKPYGGDYRSLRGAIFGLLGICPDLVALDAILRIECHAMEDTGRVDITDDWTTDAAHYIHIVAPPGQRHRGRWSDGAYRLCVDSPYWALSIATPGVRLEGLQVENRATSFHDRAAGSGVSIGGADAIAVDVVGCIVRRARPHPDPNNRGISSHYNTGRLRIGNCVVYGYQQNVAWSAARSGAELVCYASTLARPGEHNLGFHPIEGRVTARVKNTLCTGAPGRDFDLPPSATLDCAGNLSSDGTAPGAGAIHHAAVRFADAARDDYHLAHFDTAARGQGVDLSADPWWPLATDMDGDARTGPHAWSIGADAPERETVELGPQITIHDGAVTAV